MPTYPTDDLFQLIHSLDKAEQNKVEIQFNRSGKSKNNLLMLFDTIRKQNNYDEEAIKAGFEKVGRSKNIAVAKTQLVEFILEVMRGETHDRFPKERVQGRIKDIRFLQSKCLYKHSDKLLLGIKNEAQKYDLLHEQLELLDIERERLLSIRDHRVESELEGLIEHSAMIRKKIDNIYYYRDLYDRLYKRASSNLSGISEDERLYFEGCFKDPLMSAITQALSFSAKQYFYQAHAIYAQLVNDNQQALSNLEYVVMLWETNAHQMQGYSPQGYMKALVNYAGLGIVENSETDVTAALKKLEIMQAKTMDDKAEKIQNLVHLQILHHVNNCRFEEAKKVFILNKQEITKHARRFNPSRLITIVSNTILAFFFCGDYADALKWIREIQNPGRKSKFFTREQQNIRADFRISLCILELIIRLEYVEADKVEAVDEFDNTLRRNQDYIRKINKQNQISLSVFNFIRSVFRLIKDISMVVDEDKPEMYVKIKSLINKYQEENNNTLPAGIEELMLFIESRASKKDIVEVYKARKEERKIVTTANSSIR